jgi:allophanate hydrolase
VSPAVIPPSPHALRISELHAAFRSGALCPSDRLRAAYARIRSTARAEVWTLLRPQTEVLEEASRLDQRLAREGADVLRDLPLFGVPFAVKDNIDVAGQPTTAACPEFAYVPPRSAVAVQRLLDAGALLLGKTNLDQFATGLVGTRSPYGAVRNAIDPAYISGGSSSGSAVAVALGLASFALGTDTAGSGRVPAGMNGIVGLKPTRGLVSSRGVLPACRTLDCVSVFAVDLSDAWRVLQVMAAPDADDVYSRRLRLAPPLGGRVRLGIARRYELFDPPAVQAMEQALVRLATAASVDLVEVEFEPLLQAAQLLYHGPWLAERRLAVGEFFERRPDAIDPVVRGVLEDGERYSARDAFKGEYQLAAYRAAARRLFAQVDALLVPTAPLHPRIKDVQADPVRLNSRLGTYTNFVNLLDMAAVAIPAVQRVDGLPFGVTLLGPAASDHRLAVLAAQLLAAFGSGPTEAAAQLAADPLPYDEPTLDLAVVGAHLSGQPLNHQLTDAGARLRWSGQTAARYRLYALANSQPPKPALVRSAQTGAAIAIEVWQMPRRAFGGFIGNVSSPLAIGSIELADGRWVKGFVCEPCALDGASDITDHGGWRAYLSSRSA